MFKHSIVGLTAIIYCLVYLPIAFPHAQPTLGFSIVPDAEADFLISKRVFQGEGLYSSFSILYPPGRFFIQALLFVFFTPSFGVTSVFHIAIVLAIFPSILFVLSFYVFDLLQQHILKKIPPAITFFISYSLALLTLFLNMSIVRSAQETHLITGIFITALLIIKTFSPLRLFILGLLMGLIFLFRVDAGIILTLSLFGAIGFRFNEQILKKPTSVLYAFLGFATIWIPTLLSILLHGSIVNFFYDTLILGLWIQPKYMSLPIPENDLGLVFLSSLIFMVGTALALFYDAAKIPNEIQKSGLKILALTGILSFVAALGRSDEPHLWYGLIWVSLFSAYALFRILVAIKNKEWPVFKQIFLMSIFLYLFGWITITLKAPILFLIGTVLCFMLLAKIKLSSLSILIATLIVSLTIFHSLSYLKLKFYIPHLPTYPALSFPWITAEEGEVGGLQLQADTKVVLDQIRSDIPTDEKYLFIFPTNLLYNEYFNLKHPTRYILISQERSPWTENDAINSLEKTNVQYVLVFRKAAELREGPLWEWILKNTALVKSYPFGQETAELRKKAPSLLP